MGGYYETPVDGALRPIQLAGVPIAVDFAHMRIGAEVTLLDAEGATHVRVREHACVCDRSCAYPPWGRCGGGAIMKGGLEGTASR